MIDTTPRKTGPVWVLHHLGDSYGAPSIPADVEKYDTLYAALEAADDRYENGYIFAQDFAYVNRPAQSVLAPAVTHDWLDVFLADPSDEPYPADARYERDDNGVMRAGQE